MNTKLFLSSVATVAGAGLLLVLVSPWEDTNATGERVNPTQSEPVGSVDSVVDLVQPSIQIDEARSAAQSASADGDATPDVTESLPATPEADTGSPWVKRYEGMDSGQMLRESELLWDQFTDLTDQESERYVREGRVTPAPKNAKGEVTVTSTYDVMTGVVITDDGVALHVTLNRGDSPFLFELNDEREWVRHQALARRIAEKKAESQGGK